MISLYPALASMAAVIALIEARSWFSGKRSLFSERLPPVALTCLVFILSYFFVPAQGLITLSLVASVTLLWQAATPFTFRSMLTVFGVGWLAREIYVQMINWQVIPLRHGFHILIPAVAAGLVLWLLPRSAAARLHATAGFALWSAASAAVLCANAINGVAVERCLVTACDGTWSAVAVVCAIDVLATLCWHARNLYHNPQYPIRLTVKHVLEHNE